MELNNTPQGEAASPVAEIAAPMAEEPQEGKTDYWEEAKEAFNDPSSITEPTLEEQQVTDESHIEQVEPESVEKLMDLSTLACAGKYKPAVQERMAKLNELHQKEAQTINESLGQHRESLTGLVNVFQEIARNPQKIVDYVAEYGEQIGLEPEVIQHYAQLKNGASSNGQRQEAPPAVQNGQEAAKAVAIDAIVDKYADALISTQDPRQFVSILKQQNMEIAQSVKQDMLGTVGNLLKLYHEQMVAPDKQTLNEFRTKAEQDAQTARFETTRSSWNNAVSKVKEKFQDFDKYEGKIRQRLKEDPNFSELRVSINKDPKNIERRTAILEHLYKLESRDDHFSRLNSPKPKQTGLMPNSKHISTKNSGPVSWDTIREEVFS